MKPAPFDYVRAESIAEAHDVLSQNGGDARVLAGGQTLIPMLSMRLARPKVLIDIMAIGALASVDTGSGQLRIGAAVRQAQLMARPDLGETQPLLALALPWVGHAQTRSRGTLCGSVAHADPSAEIPLVLVALDGEVELSARRRRRTVPASEFFTGMMSTDRREDEMIEAIRIPTRAAATGYAFREFGRRHGDFAIVACAAVASPRGARLAVGGVADLPTARDFGDLAGAGLDGALQQFAFDLEARDDLHASGSYRRALVCSLGREVIEEARRQCAA
jgi:2-furoyl-CoA dehydrogenase FAD binding subunit